MSRITMSGFFIAILAVIAPEVALADWKVYFTGQAQAMWGAAGRGNFATRSQCEAYISSSAGFERNNSHCAGFDNSTEAPSMPGGTSGDNGASAGVEEAQRQQRLQEEQQERESELARQKERELARQKKFADEKAQLLGTLKGAAGGGTPRLKSGGTAPLPLKGSSPETVAASSEWTPNHCQAAQRRVAAYQDALRQTVAVAERFSRTIAADQKLREEWENTMSAATERAMNRAPSLLLALPLAVLDRINAKAAAGLEKDGADLANLLASTADPQRRNNIRIARQFVAREKQIVRNLGASYKDFGRLVPMTVNATQLLNPDDSPTSWFDTPNYMRLRAAAEEYFHLTVDSGVWQSVTGNAQWSKYLASGLSHAFKSEIAARAMVDSLYDAFASGLAWEQLYNMNLNSDRFLEGVQKLKVEMRKRSDRFNTAKMEFDTQCLKPR